VSERDRAVAFLRETYRRRVERVEQFAWGELLITSSLPRIYDANLALVDRWDDTAAALLREMDRVQRAHGFAHRKVVLPDAELARGLWPGLVELDWELSNRALVMVHAREPDRPPDPSIEVLTVGDVDWARGRQAMIELEPHGEDAEVVRQLLQLDLRLARELEVRHLAARVDGEVASYAGLYMEAGVAQIEDVATLPEHRGRGLARAVVLQAVADARRDGADVVFLVADAADWPQELYRRLGFDEVTVEHMLGRPARHHS
jgi:ribosomal protein S18 acetylase RimI-like enzyme